MKLLGTISELVKVILRKSTYEVTVQPSTVTADTTFELPAAGGGTKAIVTADSSAILTNKTIDADGVGNSISNIDDGNIKAGAAIDATKIADGSVTSTEFQTLSDINTALTIQAQLNAKEPTITGAATTITSSNLTVSRALASDASGKVAVSSVTSTELGYVSGVSSAIQTQLNNKEPTISVLTTAKGGTGVNSTATFPSTGTVVTRDSTDTLLNKTTISSTALATGALTLPTGNSTTERPTGTAAQLKGMVRYNDTDDVFEGYNELSGWSSIGGGGTTDRVTQVSHAFAVGDVLYLNGATYTKARADVANTAEVVGMVSRVIDANIFEITLSGEVSGLTGLTVGEVYFLSPITAGATTTTEPSVVGQVSLPVGIASSTTTMYVQPKRGVLVGATNVRTQIALANNATTTVQNVSAYDAGELSGSIVIAATASLRFFVSAQFSRNGAGTNYNVSYQASGDTPPVGFQITITAAGLLQVVMPSVAGFTSAAITYGLDVAAVGATLPLSINPSIITAVDTATEYAGNTRLGFMKYLHGVSYNGGIAPTVTLSAGGGTITSVNRAVFIPYQLADGIWRVKFNINVSLSTLTRTQVVLAINGITSPSVIQSVSGYIAGINVPPRTRLDSSTNTFTADFASTIGSDLILVSGDVELNSKPTWAY